MLFEIKKILLTISLLGGISFAGASNCADGMLIDSIGYEGLVHTKPRVVERELLHQKGNTFSVKDFESEKSRLQDLDLFTEISASCVPLGDGNQSFRLTYRFTEIFRWIPAPAGKKTDRDGLMVGLALANLNVAGEDIRAEVQYRTAVDPIFESNEYAFYASSPYFLGFPLGWNFEFLRTDSWDDLRKFQDESWLVDLDLDLDIKTHFSLLASAAYRFLEGGPGHLPEFGAGFALDFRDSELDARRGIYQEYMLTHVGVGKSKGDDYWELLSDSRAYFTLGSRFVTGATALFRYRPGQVGRYDYFYHGGANTFRGHESDSMYLGVHEGLFTLEERFVLMERRAASVLGVNFFYGVQLVAGLDGSLLWDEETPSWKNYEGAVYGGLHLIIPALERVRLEIGYSPDKGEPVFYFGLFDKTTSARWRSR